MIRFTPVSPHAVRDPLATSAGGSPGPIAISVPMKDLPAPLLRTFLAVVEARNFSRAAQELGATQPAVSLQVQRLEKLVGAPLLERTTRSVQPTEAALRLIPIAREILRLQVIALARIDARMLSGTVRIGADESVALGSGLIETVRDFTRTWPEVELRLEIAAAGTLQEGFERHELDLLLEHEDAVPDGAIVVFRERLLWHGHATPATDRMPWPVIAPPAGSILRRRSDSALAGAIVHHRSVFEAPSLAICVEAVRRGLGIMALPASVGQACALERPVSRRLPALGGTSVLLRQQPEATEAVVALRNALRVGWSAQRARGRTRAPSYSIP